MARNFAGARADSGWLAEKVIFTISFRVSHFTKTITHTHHTPLQCRIRFPPARRHAVMFYLHSRPHARQHKAAPSLDVPLVAAVNTGIVHIITCAHTFK